MKIVYYISTLFVFIFSNAQLDVKNQYGLYCGKKINDPYKDFENTNDLKHIEWFKNETTKANELLNRIEGKDELFNKFISFYDKKDEKIYNVKITGNKKYFYLKENKEGVGKLYYRKGFGEKEVFLFSPKSYNSKLNRNYRINYINPSWDDEKIAISLSYDGKELSDVVILDVDSKRVLPEIITNVVPRSFFGINWLPDNKSFMYLYFPTVEGDSFRKNSKMVHHVLGEEVSKRKIILSIEKNPDIVKSKEDYPAVVIESFDSKYAVAYIAGVDSFWDAYYTEIDNLYKDSIDWKPLYKKKDKVYRDSGILKGSTFFYKTAKKSSDFSIESFSLKTPSVKEEIATIKGEVIEDIVVTSEGVLFTAIKNGIESKLYLKSKELEEIKLPKKAGNIYLDGTSKKGNTVYLTSEGWLNDYVDYHLNINNRKLKKKDVVPNVEYAEFKSVEVDEIEIPSYDGTLVPLTILYNKNIKKNSKNPTMITGYGAYGSSYKPYFSALFLNFVAEGGVVAIAHVRGGGEKGDDWHKAGQKVTKPNTWKDLIACTEYLIKEQYTSSNHIAIRSSSAGGIMVGRAMTERPDLFKVVVSEVGQMNPTSNESRDGGDGGNSKEYGSIKDSIECQALIEMDPYLHIQDKGVNYPATLLTAGANDPRMPVWIPGKFAARLKASETKNPVLFKVDYKSGHYGGNSIKDKIRNWASIYSFILWQTGHPDYQLKE